MSRRLYFQQITDSRFTPADECLPLLNSIVNQLKELLTIEGVEINISETRFIDWTNESKAHREKLRRQGYKIEEPEEEKQIQYRVDFYVTKTTRKISWNDIYKLVNSVKAVSYQFI